MLSRLTNILTDCTNSDMVPDLCGVSPLPPTYIKIFKPSEMQFSKCSLAKFSKSEYFFASTFIESKFPNFSMMVILIFVKIIANSFWKKGRFLVLKKP